MKFFLIIKLIILLSFILYNILDFFLKVMKTLDGLVSAFLVNFLTEFLFFRERGNTIIFLKWVILRNSLFFAYFLVYLTTFILFKFLSSADDRVLYGIDSDETKEMRAWLRQSDFSERLGYFETHLKKPDLARYYIDLNILKSETNLNKLVSFAEKYEEGIEEWTEDEFKIKLFMMKYERIIALYNIGDEELEQRVVNSSFGKRLLYISESLKGEDLEEFEDDLSDLNLINIHEKLSFIEKYETGDLEDDSLTDDELVFKEMMDKYEEVLKTYKK